MSRRGCSLPANASGFEPHRASITSRFGQVFDQRGYITHLTNGVQPPPTARRAPPTTGSFQNDYTYTLVQPVASQPDEPHM
jgi:hypothetical protein